MEARIQLAFWCRQIKLIPFRLKQTWSRNWELIKFVDGNEAWNQMNSEWIMMNEIGVIQSEKEWDEVEWTKF